MNRRRRLLLDSTKKHYIFVEGSSEIINAGSFDFDKATVKEFIGIDGVIKHVVGDEDYQYQGYGWIRIHTDFSHFKKLCIEAENKSGTEGAVGFGAYYNGDDDSPKLPANSKIVAKGKEVFEFDISNVSGGQYIVGVLTSVRTLSRVTDALKIYNVWLE